MRNKLFDLKVRIKSKELGNSIYTLTSKDSFKKDWGLRDQLRRAVISISSNIAEGYYRSSKNDFRRYLQIAKGSCGEIISQLTMASELGFINKNDNIDDLLDEFDHLSRMIGKLIVSLKKSSITKK